MMNTLRVTAVACLVIASAARADCLKGNSGIPPGANTTDPSGPFYIDTSGLDFKTSPPTRDPKNPNYPTATELPDGTLPPIKAEGNFIIGPTHSPAPETDRSGRRADGQSLFLHHVVERQHGLQSRFDPG